MSHIVIHEDPDGTTRYEQFSGVEDAAGYLETLHNDEGVDGARLYELREVEFSVRSYIKVEIGGVETGEEETPADEPTHGGDAAYPGTPEFAATPEYVSMDDVEYVDATLPPSDGAPSADAAEPIETAGGEPRRGLFGR